MSFLKLKFNDFPFLDYKTIILRPNNFLIGGFVTFIIEDIIILITKIKI